MTAAMISDSTLSQNRPSLFRFGVEKQPSSKTRFLRPMRGLFSGSLLLLSLCFSPVALGASPAVDVDVQIEGKADYKGSETKTQNRKLKINLENRGKEAATDVKVKWWIFGHDMKSRKLIILKNGERQVGVPVNEKIEVSSPEVKITGTREHKVTTRKGRGKNSRPSTKTVPASGQEYYGYAVEVYSGKTLIEATYSKPSFKEKLHPRSD